MATRRQTKANQNLFKQIWKLHSAMLKWLIRWFLRSLLVLGRQFRLAKSGFIMPTVAMVMLVVVLMSTALLVRSLDRSKYASNVRVNQAVINAATPALDRARAKIDALLNDPTLPRGTPSDIALYQALSSNKYNLGDENLLKLVYDIDGKNGIKKQPDPNYILEKDETLNTAWKFPVDIDNNGRFDSYTLYGIYFRSPSRDTNANFDRARNPLEARTPPMGDGQLGGRCAAALSTSAGIVGASDWYKTGNKLTKSFFVYTATVPITNIDNLDQDKYEKYQGNQGFSALELQQDRTRIPLNNNAAWYEDDIEVSNATPIRLNGRVFTNSNLMVAGNGSSSKMIFYQVSDPDSCYYDQENSKITVSGNVANGNIELTTDDGNVEVHRFQGKNTQPEGQNNTADGISSTNKTTTQTGGRWVGYNNTAYSQRIGLLVRAALALHGTTDPTITSVKNIAQYPQEVKDRFEQRFNNSNETKKPKEILTEELETYFKQRTRRVPYAEVPGANNLGTALGSYTEANVLGSTNPIRPPDTWMAIESPTTGSTTTGLTLNFSSNTMNLRATEPTKQQKDGKEYFIGDRILVGNNLPFFWTKYTSTGGSFDKFANEQEQQPVKNGGSTIYWNDSTNGNATNINRTRQSQIQFLPDLGSIERDGFWETEAAKQPASNENTGGLRVITGAGIYIDGVSVGALGGTGIRDTNSFLPTPVLNSGVPDPDKFSGNNNIIVWPDLMPMWDGSKKGDLQMRATAVYHYKQGSAAIPGSSQIDPNQVPIACVSSYYDPANSTTARNLINLPDVSGTYDTNGDGTIDQLADGSAFVARTNGHQSNNGVTYNTPYTNDSGRTTAVGTYRAKLNRQAMMIFPTGRIVNQPLRKALANIDANKPRSLADNAAIDTAICALKILDGTLTVQASPNIPHGAIKEAAFLDGRQIESLNNDIKPDGSLDNTKIAETKANLTASYTLPLEQRQPLEIRVTELDLNLLRNKEIGTATDTSTSSTNNQEYLLPNSGIIYATRDDALPDESDSNTDETTKKLVSPTDFELDSTRRPNGVRLINGSNLARKNFYRVAEKGLILATNLPAYIKGDFNLHKDPNSTTAREEFAETLAADWSNFYTRANTLDTNFACRQNQLGCSGSGDQWRPVTIISDAQTLLSNNFWDGFRNQGDYDLNNNWGNSAASSRRRQGFWNSNFVTSADWAGTDGYPTSRNSYLTNGVTPIQRRVNGFPEYIMEICRKLPVSQCGLNDWVVGFDTNGDGILNNTEINIKANQLGQILAGAGKIPFSNILSEAQVNWSTKFVVPGTTGNKSPLERLGAGTTARPALVAADRRYPRRVAFARNQLNTLVFASIGTNNAAKPLGVGCALDALGTNFDNNGCQYPSGGTLAAGVHYGNLANNALWFRTTNNTSGDPGALADITYAANRPLYYLPEPIGEKMILPPTPEIPGVTTLNGSGTTDPSDYTMCLTSGSGGQSQKYLATGLTGSCPSTFNLNPQVGQLLGLTSMGTLTNSSQTLTASTTTNLNVYKLSSGNPDINSGATITLNGNADSIFVFQGSNSVQLGSNGGAGITLVLNGVSPNNIFWVSNGSLDINDATTAAPHRLAGNFIGKTSLKIGVNTQILGGRFLNFTTLPGGGIPTTAKIYAVTSDGQPSLVPVLQIHSPTGTPGGTIFNGTLPGNWVQVATSTTANAAFITGDTPSRPNPSETNGGFHNFIRFQENWSGQTARITGSFIQYKRSAYGSAPFYPVDPTITDATSGLFYTLDAATNSPAYNSSVYTGFRYRGGVFAYRASYYAPPTRAYGFDVALLSQPPDLFAQRFTSNTTIRPKEYFREVGRDDLWINTLLCAAEFDQSSRSYTKYVIDEQKERPEVCRNRPLSDYNN